MKISELQSFWTKGKRSPSLKKPVPPGTKFASIDGTEYTKVGGGWMLPSYDLTDPSNPGKPVDAVKAKQLDTEYWITQANKSQLKPKYAKMGFKIVSLEPEIISYKSTDYILGDDGNWVSAKGAKKPAPQIASILDAISGLDQKPEDHEHEFSITWKDDDDVRDVYKTASGAWFIDGVLQDSKKVIDELERVAKKRKKAAKKRK